MRRSLVPLLRPTCGIVLLTSTLLCIVTLWMLIDSVAAHAAVTEELLSQITSIPAEGPHSEAVALPGKLSGVNSMAVDAGGLYVGERIEGTGSSRVDEFDVLSDAFVSQLDQVAPLEGAGADGVAVGAASGGQVYVGAVESVVGEPDGVVAVFGAGGNLLTTWLGANTPSGSFGRRGVRGVAVDDSVTDPAAGDVYIADDAEAEEPNEVVPQDLRAVDVLKPEMVGGKPSEAAVTQITGISPTAPFYEPRGVSVDESTGEVLVLDKTESGAYVVDVFMPEPLGVYRFVRQISGPHSGDPFGVVKGLAVDGGNGDVYVAEEGAGGLDVVDHFDSAGSYMGRLVGTPAGAFEAVESVAVDPASGRVFVGDARSRGGVVDVYGPSVKIPAVSVTEPVSELAPTSVTLHGAVDPEATGAASCEFELGTTASYGLRAACASTVGEGDSPVAVQSISATGLAPDTTYNYRLDATNIADGHTTVGECPEDCGQFTTSGPGIESESVSDVGPTAATLEGVINPDGAPTSYRFEYDITAYEGSAAHGVSVPVPGDEIGAGAAEVRLAPEQVQGLVPGTVYHYRVVASSEIAGKVEEFDGPDATFTTQTSGAFVLSDGRQWELVSPANKRGANIEPVGDDAVIQASPAGEALTYATNAATEAEPQGSANLVQSIATRGPDGWASRNVSIPHQTATGPAVGQEGEFRFFSEDLSLSVIQPFGELDASLSAQASEPTAYLATDYLDGSIEDPCTSACYRPLVTGAPGYVNVPAGTVFGDQNCAIHGSTELFCGPKFVGATPDLSHIVLQSSVALTEGGGSGGFGGLYDWVAGKLAPVSVLPESEQGGAAVAGSLGSSLGDNGVDVRHAVSADGSRIVWEGGEGSSRHLYLRDTVSEETVRLDVPQPGAPPESGSEPEFQDASSDGSRVFFTDTAPLTEDSGAAYEKPDLYECEIVEEPGGPHCDLSDLTPLGPGESSADVRGAVLGASEDGGYVYFAAGGVLAPGAEPGACEGTGPGSTCNLYVIHDGETKLAAVVAGGDSPDWGTKGAALARLTARVSPNGRWLAFMSERSLTGYDNLDAVSGHGDEEVYLYDAEASGGAGGVVCVSCAPSGARPVGVEYGPGGENVPLVGAGKIWEADSWLAADLPGWTSYSGADALYQSRYLSNSGRLFFNSHDALVPQDVNGTWDVYEYEPPGVGSCTGSQSTLTDSADGCIGLMSSGSSPEESAFLEASATGGRNSAGTEGGGDVFFLTSAKLSTQDLDTSLDVYDAHECTNASPCPPPSAAQPPECSTEASCKAAPMAQPDIYGTPPSATVNSTGNLPLSEVAPKPKALTRAQKLARALKACKRKPQKKRAACQRQARRAYGPVGKAMQSHRKKAKQSPGEKGKR
jgi:hypothetical protein